MATFNSKHDPIDSQACRQANRLDFVSAFYSLHCQHTKADLCQSMLHLTTLKVLYVVMELVADLARGVGLPLLLAQQTCTPLQLVAAHPLHPVLYHRQQHGPPCCPCKGLTPTCTAPLALLMISLGQPWLQSFAKRACKVLSGLMREVGTEREGCGAQSFVLFW